MALLYSTSTFRKLIKLMTLPKAMLFFFFFLSFCKTFFICFFSLYGPTFCPFEILFTIIIVIIIIIKISCFTMALPLGPFQQIYRFLFFFVFGKKLLCNFLNCTLISNRNKISNIVLQRSTSFSFSFFNFSFFLRSYDHTKYDLTIHMILNLESHNLTIP